LTFSGSQFLPNEKVKIYKGGVGSAVLASTTADAGGNFTVSAENPEAVSGPRIFLGSGQNSGKLGAASFSMLPRLFVTPSSGSPGNTVSVSGYGFGASDSVQINWLRPDTFLSFVTVDAYGTFRGTGAFKTTVPSGATPGTNGVVGIGHLPHVFATGRFTVE
jgi:hypothetical protein